MSPRDNLLEPAINFIAVSGPSGSGKTQAQGHITSELNETHKTIGLNMVVNEVSGPALMQMMQFIATQTGDKNATHEDAAEDAGAAAEESPESQSNLQMMALSDQPNAGSVL